MPTDLGVHFWSGANGGGGGGGSGNAVGNVVALGNGAQTGTVTFAAAFTGTPAVVATISSSNDSADLLSVIATSVTSAGFKYTLSTATRDTTYSLNWIASTANG